MGLSLQIHNRERVNPKPLEILHSNGSSMPLVLAEQLLIWHNSFQHPQVILLVPRSQAAPHPLKLHLLSAAVFTVGSSLSRVGFSHPSPPGLGEFVRMKKGLTPKIPCPEGLVVLQSWMVPAHLPCIITIQVASPIPPISYL